MDKFKSIIHELKDMYDPYHEGLKTWNDTVEKDTQNLILPPWLCQSYVRDTPENHIKKIEEMQQEQKNLLVT